MVDTPALRIKIAKLQFCHHDECRLGSNLNLHLIVDYDYVELEKTKALAISYTWGEFDRQDVVIGHRREGKLVSMNLGREWEVQDTIQQLAMLCIENGEEHGEEHAGIWVDQLCIEQSNHEEVKATLASIPSIYRSLEVIVMLPGGNCACLPETFDALQALAPNASEKEVADLMNDPIGDKIKCMNYLGMCSYFDRVWTRQELLYATSVRVTRVRSDVLPCARVSGDSANLSSYAYQLYSQHHDPKVGYLELLKVHSIFIDNVQQSTCELERSGTLLGTRHTHREKSLNALAFLLGHKLVRWRKINQDDDPNSPFYFFTQLAEMAGSIRKASRPIDYVVSVWVDCPKYEIPENFDTMSLPSLLEDAIKQMEEKLGFSIWTSRLPGLFSSGNIDESVLWRPTRHISAEPEHAGEIYKPILQAEPLSLLVDRRFVPLEVSWPLLEPLSCKAQGYAQHFVDHTIEDVMHDLGEIVQRWAVTPVTRLLRAMLGWSQFRDGEDGEFNEWKFLMFCFSKELLVPSPRDEFRNCWDSKRAPPAFTPRRLPQVFDHHELMYEAAAVSLGFDADDCRSHGLRLMIAAGRGERMIGFMSKGELGLGRSAVSEVITVTTAAHQESEVGILEARLSETPMSDPSNGKSYPRYRAVGIWVPLNKSADFKGTMSTHVGLKSFNAVLR